MTTNSAWAIIWLSAIIWFLLGIAYESLQAHYWPKRECTRGKWTPQDRKGLISIDPDMEALRGQPEAVQTVAVYFGLFLFAATWPYWLYDASCRKFRTKPDTPAI